MAQFFAVTALGNTSVNWNASISKSLLILPSGSWPAILLFWTHWLVGKAPSDGIFLIKVTLEIHVGVCRGQLLLETNEVDTEILGTETLLDLDVSGIGGSFEVTEGSFLDVIKIALAGSNANLLPGNLGLNVFDAGIFDLSA
jgi:hypothetical protein